MRRLLVLTVFVLVLVPTGLWAQWCGPNGCAPGVQPAMNGNGNGYMARAQYQAPWGNGQYQAPVPYQVPSYAPWSMPPYPQPYTIPRGLLVPRPYIRLEIGGRRYAYGEYPSICPLCGR